MQSVQVLNSSLQYRYHYKKHLMSERIDNNNNQSLIVYYVIQKSSLRRYIPGISLMNSFPL